MKNKFPQKNYKNVSNYFEDYSNSLKSTMDVISRNDLEKISKIIEKTIRSNSNIFICGNGGSSSVSNHFLCDFQKGLLIDRKLKLKTYSLTSNTDLITAISNDISYEKIFSLQLDSLARKNDLLVLFSVSGSSKNIIEACKIAKRNKLKIISFVGFKNSKLKKYSNICLELNNYNFGISEDIFQALMHSISQYLRQKKLTNKKVLKKYF
jgi:phosphoheptose isomerase